MSFCTITGYKQMRKEFESGHVIGCAKCNSEFEEEDFAFALETGTCPYCHKEMDRGLVQ